MFVRPEQMAEVARRHAELKRLRLVVTRAGEIDAMTLRAESESNAPSLQRAVGETRRSITSWVVRSSCSRRDRYRMTEKSSKARAAFDGVWCALDQLRPLSPAARGRCYFPDRLVRRRWALGASFPHRMFHGFLGRRLFLHDA